MGAPAETTEFKKLTGPEVLKIIEENTSVHDFAYNDVDYQELNLGKVEEVDQYGGEDQGSSWYSVKHFVDHDVYIRTDGYYQSYNGTDFHDGHGSVVAPKQKTITVFE